MKKFIRKHCIEHGHFKLKCGIESDLYVDCKKLVVSDHLLEITKSFYSMLYPFDFDAIGAVELGGVSLLGSLLSFKQLYGSKCRGFIVRKEEKDHGKSDIVIGTIQEGDRVAIIEDVTTSGGSLMRAVEEVKKLNCKVVCVATIIDREMGAKELFEKNNIPFMCLFPLNSIMKENYEGSNA